MTYIRQCSAVAILILSSLVSAAEFPPNRILDGMTYTINPVSRITGPIFRDQSDAKTKSKYVTDILKIILKEADNDARKYLDAGDYEAYNAFLILSLSVPLHEGMLIHFRGAEGKACYKNVNNGTIIKRASEKSYSIFKKYFKESGKPFIPACEEVAARKSVNQMIRGGDGTDISIMQISIRWHFNDYLAQRKYESVEESIRFGGDVLKSGFDSVYRNATHYGCLIDVDKQTQKKKINYSKLIRGVWAGEYNSGSLAKTCRFNNSGSLYKASDIAFNKALNKVLKFDGVITPRVVGDLQVESQMSLAIKNIVKNFTTGKKANRELDIVLGKTK